ncbi:MAG: TIR domain-containing protein [Methylomarinum sp.]|nr:TIR domain-containing protein [Methylomarinum sp.]
MKVFISWSGHRSRAVAELLDDWIQCVLQAIRPWMSSKDIDRGSLWFSEITDQLKDTTIGVVCLTKDNLDKPWILFESGALAKGLSSSRVCTFLIDLDPTDVGNPLAQFNHTLPNKDGLYELVRTLNSSLGEHSLREKVLEQVFNTYWPQFEKGFELALKENPIGEHVVARTEENILSEVLRTVRTLDRRVRTMEQSPSNTEIDNIVLRKTEHARKRSTGAEIQHLISSGIPPEAVEEIMEGKTSKSTIRNYIHMALEGEKNRIDESEFNG